jgi:hypothetical protein
VKNLRFGELENECWDMEEGDKWPGRREKLLEDERKKCAANQKNGAITPTTL